MNRRIARDAVRVIALTSGTVMLAACGGGKDETYSNYCPGPCYTDPGPVTATTSAVSWDNRVRFDVPAHGTFQLGVSANNTVQGLNRVEFNVDGQVVATSMGKPNPNTAVSLYFTADWQTANVTDGYHTLKARVVENDGEFAETPPAVVRFENNVTLPFVISSAEIYPPIASSATGTGQFFVNLATGTVTGSLTLANMTATSVHIHDGNPTDTGDEIVSLTYDAGAGRWIVPAGAMLNTNSVYAGLGLLSYPGQTDKLYAGRLYVDAHSSYYSGGEARAQLLTRAMRLRFSYSANQPSPANVPAAYAAVATTTDSVSQLYRVDVHAIGALARDTGLDAYSESSQSPAYIIFKTTPNHWSRDLSGDLPQLRSGYYVIIGSPSNPEHVPYPSVSLPHITTLSEIQTAIFTPKCSSCHNGSGSTLPGSMNLANGFSYTSLVNITSIGQSNLKRVNPGHFESSFLAHKVVGAPTIPGNRMPLNGPYLDENEIDAIKSWIDQGALPAG